MILIDINIMLSIVVTHAHEYRTFKLNRIKITISIIGRHTVQLWKQNLKLKYLNFKQQLLVKITIKWNKKVNIPLNAYVLTKIIQIIQPDHSAYPNWPEATPGWAIAWHGGEKDRQKTSNSRLEDWHRQGIWYRGV